jgi:aspartate/methionine/tyrosine aminotransferase
LFIIATALLRPNDHLVVVRPNYATNLETPRAIGCAVSHIDLSFESGFRIDLEKLAASVTPKTKLISITSPHNPTGVGYSESDLRFLVAWVRLAYQ